MQFNAKEFKENLTSRLKLQYGKDLSQATKHDLFDAVSASALELIMDNWMKTRAAYDKKPTRQVYYLSAEFLMGRAMSNNLINAQIKDAVVEESVSLVKNKQFLDVLYWGVKSKDELIFKKSSAK